MPSSLTPTLQQLLQSTHARRPSARYFARSCNGLGNGCVAIKGMMVCVTLHFAAWDRKVVMYSWAYVVCGLGLGSPSCWNQSWFYTLFRV